MSEGTTKYRGFNRDDVSNAIVRISAECLDIYEKAHKEYAHEEDRPFRNFEETANLLGTTREHECLTFLLKHLFGIIAHVNGHETQRESITGRFRDIHNYLFILECMLTEGREKSEIQECWDGLYDTWEDTDEQAT